MARDYRPELLAPHVVDDGGPAVRFGVVLRGLTNEPIEWQTMSADAAADFAIDILKTVSYARKQAARRG